MRLALFITLLFAGVIISSFVFSAPVFAQLSEWFVTYSGDVHAEGDITNNRPIGVGGSSPGCDTSNFRSFMSLINEKVGAVFQFGGFDAGPTSGIITHTGAFSGGCITSTSENVPVNDAVPTPVPYTDASRPYDFAGATLNNVKNDKKYYGFDYYANHINNWTIVSGTNLTNGALNRGDFIRYNLTSGDTLRVNPPLTISAADRKVVLVNGGSVSIERGITVDPGGFFALIASGDITIDPDVGGTKDNPALQGVYITDGTIRTGTNNPIVPPGERISLSQSRIHNWTCDDIQVSQYADTTLYAAGTFIAWGGWELLREISPDCLDGGVISKNSGDYVSTPGEVFGFRPDFLLSAPFEMKEAKSSYTEEQP